MKKQFVTILLLAFIVSCKNGSNKPEDSDLSFKNYFEFFSKDSVFQASRVSFPLEYKTLDIEDEEETINILKSEWKFVEFNKDSDAVNQQTDKFSPKITEISADTMMYVREGIDNGIYIEYTFVNVKGKWFLVRVLDSSN